MLRSIVVLALALLAIGCTSSSARRFEIAFRDQDRTSPAELLEVLPESIIIQSHDGGRVDTVHWSQLQYVRRYYRDRTLPHISGGVCGGATGACLGFFVGFDSGPDITGPLMTIGAGLGVISGYVIMDGVASDEVIAIRSSTDLELLELYAQRTQDY